MSKYTTNLICPGCKFKTLVGFKKPDYWTPRVVSYVCDTCESSLMVRIAVPKGAARGAGQANVRMVTPSKKLLDMLREEAEFNKDARGGTMGETETSHESNGTDQLGDPQSDEGGRQAETNEGPIADLQQG